MMSPTVEINDTEPEVQHLYCPICRWSLTVYYREEWKAIDLAYAHDRLHARAGEEHSEESLRLSERREEE